MTGTVRHPVFARVYARLVRAMDEGGLAEHRRSLLAGLSGTVLELGAGSGANFAHYPPTVSRVVAIEPEPYLRARAVGAARQAPVAVEVVDGAADRLPATDMSYDAAVVTLVLCSVPDQARALAELYRVLRPGGELRFLEHVRADSPGLRRLQRAADATLWPLVAGGCHTGRDTATAIATAGFEIDLLDRFRLPDGGIPTPVTPHLRGRAVRP